MAFLDNSGDIILDAVLTEVGRQRLSAGNFSIRKFAFGDDEIRYDLYDKNHPSGSAYYDLEILQTPVLEAFTEINANINYGLLSFTSNRLLYLPTMLLNEKLNSYGGALRRAADSLYYLAVNDGATAPALRTAFGDAGDQYVLEAGQANGRVIVIESGLETSGDITGTAENAATYITAQGLNDSTMRVSVDIRFISQILGPDSSAYLNNNGGSGAIQFTHNLNAKVPSGGDTIANHRAADIRSPRNSIVYRLTDAITDTTNSAINGPRANFTAINLNVKPLTTDDYSRYGFTGQNLFGDGNTYNYIDSEMIVTARRTGGQIVVPFRIIKKV